MHNLAMQNAAQQTTDTDWVKQLPTDEFAQLNAELEQLSPAQRVAWALQNLPGEHIVSSSFGAQSAVMLHLLTQHYPNIPVVLTDTGYLFPETYQFVDQLTTRLSLNLQVYRAPISAAWQEARHGRLWEQGVEGIEKYNRLNKVQPMQRALTELNAGTWFAGLRRSQSDSRENLNVLQRVEGRVKVYPIIDQSNKALHGYLKEHDLPYHPLWEKGYVSIGDWHTTRALEAGMSEQDTRFFGMKRECGLHEYGDGI